MGADFFSNEIGGVIVVAPAPDGRLGRLAGTCHVELERGGGLTEAVTRWIFADVPRKTLRDDWGNPYDHQVHTLLAGTLEQGRRLLREVEDLGYAVAKEKAFFVPLQTLDPTDANSSDNLRFRHPRAFAVARREPPDEVLRAARDAAR